MKANTKNKPKKSPVTWTVKGPNWLWKKRAGVNQCPMELATLALEDVWSKDPNLQSDIKMRYLLNDDEEPTLGLTLLVSHSGMKDKGENILVCSVTALANAGYYNEANELQELT